MAKLKDLFQLLEKEYKRKLPWKPREEFCDPFKNLVIGILSQNTNDKNSRRAYLSLKQKFKIAPQVLAEAEEREIAKAIRIGGLSRVKAKRIKQMAKLVMKRFGGNLRKMLKLPTEEMRKVLLEFPGIGKKTADVFLAFCARRDVIPIDTHLAKIARRFGIVPEKAGYDGIRRAYEKLIPVGKRAKAHLYLIALGREYCKARNPNCKKCPLLQICSYERKSKKL